MSDSNSTLPCKICGTTDRYSDGKCRLCRQQSARKWKLANPEKVKEQKAQWHQKNKQRRNAASSKRPITESRRASNAAWNLENAAHKKAYNVNWEALNPESKKRRRAARRSLLKGSGGRLSKGITERLFKLQKGKCPCCGLPLGDDYHMDHKMPLFLGGTNTDDNIQLLRHFCNIQKRAQHPVDFMQSKGFLL